MIEGDDWYGPVSWTDSDGEPHTIGDEKLSAAAAALHDGLENPDAEFAHAVLAGTPATPDFAEAVKAHRIIDAMYASAANGGESVSIEVGRG